jgi:hypothetical protein
MKVVETRLKNGVSSVFPYTTYLNTYTEVEYEYPQVGVYVAALTGCCRSWDKLLNHRGYGWNISGTHLACFTGTRVHILTPAELLQPL